MSKIEVNTVEPQCGTTLTLGGSGDTVALGSGASQTGFGRTGTVDWITTPKTTSDSPVTGVTGKGYFLNTNGGTITFNLPAGSAGDIISMADYAATWQNNSVTLTPNGTDKIGGLNANTVLSTEGQSVTFVYTDSTQGWINTMDSTSNVRAASFICASVSGACNTLVTAPDCANMKIATFTGPGTFTVNSIAGDAANNLVSYMVVAGGGGGGAGGSPGYGRGGGGAGGFREVKSPVTPYTSSPLDGYSVPGNRVTVTATPYPIVVGGGGAGSNPNSPTTTKGTPGVDSSGLGITAAGGGGGAAFNPGGADNGGSGGGASDAPFPTVPNPGGSGNTPPTSPSQGNPGAASTIGGDGGGGATASGSGGPSTNNGGPGGAGATTSISGSPTAYAGGGGGSAWNGTGGTGGTGGGGNGSTGGTCAPTPAPQTAGADNTGGGGGSGGSDAGSTPGTNSAGGSGIIIIRYKYQ